MVSSRQMEIQEMSREFKFFEMRGYNHTRGRKREKKFETIHIFEDPWNGYCEDSTRIIGVRVPINRSEEIEFYEANGSDALESTDFVGNDFYRIMGVADKVKIAAERFRDAFVKMMGEVEAEKIHEISMFGYFCYRKYEKGFKFFAARIDDEERLISPTEFNDLVWQIVRNDQEITDFFYELDRVDAVGVKTIRDVGLRVIGNGCHTRHGGFAKWSKEKWDNVVFVTENKTGEVEYVSANLSWW